MRPGQTTRSRSTRAASAGRCGGTGPAPPGIRLGTCRVSLCNGAGTTPIATRCRPHRRDPRTAAACAGPAPSPSGASTSTQPPISSGRPTPLFSAAIESAAPSTQPAQAGPIASSGAIAVLGPNGGLALVGSDGGSALLANADDGTFGFPTWSPDGSRIAAIRSTGTEASIVVFDAQGALTEPPADPPAEPVVIFESAAIGPFYLFWTPDGETVSFLANEAGGLSLRIAPADGSAPLDGSGPGALVRSGSPLYYDWIEGDRLLAHIGLGPEAFLGEMGLDGEAAAPALDTPGDFRSAVVSHDQGSIAFVRASDGDPAEIVVAGRDGSNEHATAVFGSAAVVFDPTGQPPPDRPRRPGADPGRIPDWVRCGSWMPARVPCARCSMGWS